MKKWLALALTLLLTFSLTACGAQKGADASGAGESGTADASPVEDARTANEDAAPTDNAPENADASLPENADASGETGLANPFEDYASIEEAEAAAGFSFGVPEVIGGYDTVIYRVAKDISLFEVIYTGEASTLTARKAPGGWNISGDNNQYSVEVAETLQGAQVTCWGEGDSLFLAMWTADNYSYSLSVSENIDRMDFIGIVETIIDLNAA